MLEVDWAIVVAMTQALAWPAAALTAAYWLRPLVSELINRGGDVEASGFRLSLPPKEALSTAKAEIGAERVEDQVKLLASDNVPDPETDEERYGAIMRAWSDLFGHLTSSYYEQTGKWLDQRSARWGVQQMARKGILTESVTDAVNQLLSVRARAKRLGPARFSELNMSSKEVNEFVAMAKAIELLI